MMIRDADADDDFLPLSLLSSMILLLSSPSRLRLFAAFQIAMHDADSFAAFAIDDAELKIFFLRHCHAFSSPPPCCHAVFFFFR